MLFRTNEQANKSEITILSARDTIRPGFQAGASWAVMQGYIRQGITRGGHLELSTKRVLCFARFSFFFLVHDSVQNSVLVISRVNSHQFTALF